MKLTVKKKLTTKNHYQHKSIKYDIKYDRKTLSS